MYVEGSYFGDADVITNGGEKLLRDGTAIADSECHLLVGGKKELVIILRNFKDIKEEMKKVAEERRKHHR